MVLDILLPFHGLCMAPTRPLPHHSFPYLPLHKTCPHTCPLPFCSLLHTCGLALPSPPHTGRLTPSAPFACCLFNLKPWLPHYPQHLPWPCLPPPSPCHTNLPIFNCVFYGSLPSSPQRCWCRSSQTPYRTSSASPLPPLVLLTLSLSHN